MVTATLSLTTPVANGTPVVWTVSRYAPGGVPLTGNLKGFDGARRTIEGTVAGNTASLPIAATGAPTGLCVVTATVAEKMFLHTIAFVGNVSFTANLDREVLIGDQAYSASTGRDFQVNPSEYGGNNRLITLSTAAQGMIQGIPGRNYQIRFSDPNGSSGLRLGANSSAIDPNPAGVLNVTANASGLAQFWVQSTGQLSAGHVECVRLEVRDPITNQISHLQAAVPFKALGTCLFDAIGGFTGLGETSGSFTGTVASVVGGICCVNDLGVLIKNGARAAGITDGNVDKLETGLATLSGAATLASAAGVGIAPKFVAETLKTLKTLKALKPIAPKLARIFWKFLKESLQEGKEMAGAALLKYCAAHIVAPDGVRIIKACEEGFTNRAAIESIDRLSRDFGEDRVWDLMLAALDATINLSPPDKLIANKVMWLLDSLDDTAKLAFRQGTNLDEAKEISVGLAKLLTALPSGSTAKVLDPAQLKRVLGNQHLFRHPTAGMSSTYKQTDLLKDLAQVAKHADGDGVARLVHALKADSARVSGNRYALSVTAHLIKNGGATKVKFISKYVGQWGIKGSAEIDLVCEEAGQWVIYEIKSTLKAIRSNPKQFLSWRKRVSDGWPSLGLGSATPKIKLYSPLPITGSGAVPTWVREMNDNTLINFTYVPGTPFK